jgi:hypothetical protein
MILKQIAISTTPKITPGIANAMILIINFLNMYHSQLNAELVDNYLVGIEELESILRRSYLD